MRDVSHLQSARFRIKKSASFCGLNCCGHVFGGHGSIVSFALACGSYKRGEQRMRRQRFGLELGVKLAAQKPWMIGYFDDFHVGAVRCAARDPQAGSGQALFVIAVEFVTVAVSFADLRGAVSTLRERAGLVCRAGLWDNGDFRTPPAPL